MRRRYPGTLILMLFNFLITPSHGMLINRDPWTLTTGMPKDLTPSGLNDHCRDTAYGNHTGTTYTPKPSAASPSWTTHSISCGLLDRVHAHIRQPLGDYTSSFPSHFPHEHHHPDHLDEAEDLCITGQPTVSTLMQICATTPASPSSTSSLHEMCWMNSLPSHLEESDPYKEHLPFSSTTTSAGSTSPRLAFLALFGLRPSSLRCAWFFLLSAVRRGIGSGADWLLPMWPTSLPFWLLVHRFGEAHHPGPLLRIGTVNPSGVLGKADQLLTLPCGIWNVAETHLSLPAVRPFVRRLRAGARQDHRRLRVLHGALAPVRARSTYAGTWTGVLQMIDAPARKLHLPWPDGAWPGHDHPHLHSHGHMPIWMARKSMVACCTGGHQRHAQPALL